MAFCADRVLQYVNPAPGDKILDIAMGTGTWALTASQGVGVDGRATAIDTAENLLARLSSKLEQFGIRNVDVHACRQVGWIFDINIFST